METYKHEQFSIDNIKDLVIAPEHVAHVQVGNRLEHALLVLTKSGYTSIPVLDAQYRLHGLISTSLIMDAILGLERIEFEKLAEIRVEEVMNKKLPDLRPDASVDSLLGQLIDNPFLCMVDEDGFFDGILTRRAVLIELNRYIMSMKK